jgi:large subunit ribosomal protein L13
MKSSQRSKKTAVSRSKETKVVDAAGKSLGRLASEIAVILRGKDKPSFEAHMLGGDAVRVTNVRQMKVTGKKERQKVYYRNTGYLGGIRTTLLRDLKQNAPDKLLKMTVKGMLPDNKLRNEMLKRLTIE